MSVLRRPLGPLLASAASGLLLAGSFPPLDVSSLAWVALVPVLIASARAREWQTGLLTFLMGAVYAGFYLYWIRVIPGFPFPAHFLLILYIAAYYGLFGYALRLVTARACAPLMLIAPVLWVTLEFTRVNAGFLAVPGGLFGHTQYENIPLIQIASLTSAYGVSFLIVLVNAAIADAILWLLNEDDTQKRLGGVTITATLALAPIVVGLIFLWGSQKVKDYDGDSGALLKIASVQANIPQAQKWDRKHRGEILARYRKLTQAAARDQPDLIVWPEAAVPGYLRVGSASSHTVLALAQGTGVPLVIGSATSAKFTADEEIQTELKNSAFLLGREGEILGKYDKLKLLPFAEYVPLEGRFPWPAWLVRKGDSLVSGKDIALFELYGQPFGVVICWEGLFPDPFREFVRRGARFMLNLSNEARFDGTQASRQFLAMTVFRAVEHRVSLVRAANTGISAAIDPLGVIRSRVTDKSGHDLGVSGVLTVTMPVATASTFYTRHGDVFAAACVIIALALLAFALVPGWRRGRSWFQLLHRQTGRVGNSSSRTLRGDRSAFDRR